jgi:hypothetical protein
MDNYCLLIPSHLRWVWILIWILDKKTTDLRASTISVLLQLPEKWKAKGGGDPSPAREKPDSIRSPAGSSGFVRRLRGGRISVIPRRPAGSIMRRAGGTARCGTPLPDRRVLPAFRGVPVSAGTTVRACSSLCLLAFWSSFVRLPKKSQACMVHTCYLFGPACGISFTDSMSFEWLIFLILFIHVGGAGFAR